MPSKSFIFFCVCIAAIAVATPTASLASSNCGVSAYDQFILETEQLSISLESGRTLWVCGEIEPHYTKHMCLCVMSTGSGSCVYSSAESSDPHPPNPVDAGCEWDGGQYGQEFCQCDEIASDCCD